MNKPESIDQYIAGFPAETRIILEEIRETIRKVSPEAQEKISYGMPTFALKGKNLVHFAAFKNHIGFYPTPVGVKSFEKDLSSYKQGKGSVQFPLNEPMPLDLIARIVTYRAKGNL